MNPAHESSAAEPARLERKWVIMFCAVGAGLAFGFYLASRGQTLLLDWVGIIQPCVGGAVVWKQLSAVARPRMPTVAIGALMTLMSTYFNISPTIWWVGLAVALGLYCAAARGPYRLAQGLTIALCTLLMGAKIHAVFGPPAAWL